MIARRFLTTLAPLAMPPLVYWAGYFQIFIIARVGTPPHHIPCPMCHGTRAFYAFYEAAFAESLLENALVFTALVALNTFPLVFYLFATFNLTLSHKHASRDLRLLAAAIAATVALLTAFQWAVNIYREH
jgi:hypothetical protein